MFLGRLGLLFYIEEKNFKSRLEYIECTEELPLVDHVVPTHSVCVGFESHVKSPRSIQNILSGNRCNVDAK